MESNEKEIYAFNHRMAAGSFHICMIKNDGTAQGWEADSAGARSVPFNLGTVSSISAGREHTCAVKTDGTARCWGLNAPSGIGKVRSVSTGNGFTCAIKEDRTV